MEARGGESVRRCTRFGSIGVGIGILTVLLLASSHSSADWKIYVAPGLGISTANVDTDGQLGDPPTVVRLSGSDNDSSPLLDLAVGLEVPMDELVPREWLLDVRLPDWPVRFEAEAAGLREYEFRTVASGEDFFTDYKATTFFINSWVDIPLIAAYRPIQYTFGLGRQPAIRRWLEPASLYVGAGVGFSALDIDGTSNVVSGDDDPIDFAWNVGIGVNYALTETVSLSTGYRYVGLMKQKIDLRGGVGGTDDEVEFEPEVHEFRFAIRIQIFEFLSPWR
jgi:hypothetical protein